VNVKLLIVILMLLMSHVAYAESSSLNLALPQSPQSFQSDRIRSSDNIECSMAIGSSTNVEFGVVGILNQNDPFNNNSIIMSDPSFNYNTDRFIRDVGVYGKITIPIGAPKERLNCNTLYQLELEKKRLEVMKLRQEIENLKRLQFEN